MDRLHTLQALASVQGDGKGYKKLVKENVNILNPKDNVTPEELMDSVKGDNHGR
ncbi:MAG: hypothetical protein GY845_25945 [Planctomycetes bacterium]|nr:hypothetical protein [Planctomycetota bacterium]